MSSIVKSGWRYAISTIGFMLVLFLLPFFLFPSEIHACNAVWWYVVIRAILALAGAYYIYVVISTREDPAAGGKRALAIGIAVAYAIVTLAYAAQYRQDKLDHIEFDKKMKALSHPSFSAMARANKDSAGDLHFQYWDQVKREWVDQDTTFQPQSE